MRALFITIIISIALSATAQSDKFTKAMLTNIAKLDSVKTDSEKVELSNQFERIAKAEKDKWQPYYYAAMLQILRTYQMKGAGVDEVLDNADNLLISAEMVSPDNSELLCLKAMVLTARISVDPQRRGAEYSQKSTDILKKAAKLNPDNPRIYLLMAKNIFHTPAFWGGGKDKAKPVVQKSVELFEKFTPVSEIDPNWGKAMATSLLEQCNS